VGGRITESFWLEEIAEVWVPYLNHTGRGEPEWLVLSAAGLRPTFLTHATGELQEMIRQSPHTFAAYEAGDLWRALFATLDLFRRLAVETAERLDYSYPTLAEQRVRQWLQTHCSCANDQ
jgi:hypothetical protein